MKKIKHILTVIARSILILSPGIVTALYLWKSQQAWIAVAAALGVEFAFCVLIACILAVAAKVKSHWDLRKETIPDK